ncbi:MULTISPECIES: type II toxin-antitoxin system VapB family antitoxin [Rheinheimera]|uniref:type II toxin-antitoxin system VapB family antitoxin n=1 Tax=Rheinheimera TaxID=67575 RepID=UPI001BFD4278|nr:MULTISPECIES: type II toxin-antitoxin system VapB family antitoxin [Rheinheimera]MCS4307255.1 Arc/MetJ family transcription regulator [Rheinheimera pacifica]
MRTTVTIDDELYQQALALAEPGTDKAGLFREAIKTYIRVQAGRRLAALGGTTPDMPIPKRRFSIEFKQHD